MLINYFVTYPENFDIQLKKIIENLDVESFDNYIRDSGDISAVNLSMIICQSAIRSPEKWSGAHPAPILHLRGALC